MTPSETTPKTDIARRSHSGGQWFTSVITLAAGILLIAFHNQLDLIDWVVEGMGWFIIISGLYMVVVNQMRPSDERLLWQQICGVFAVGMGIWIAVAPTTFANLLIYIFAVVLILSGLWNIFSLHLMGKSYNIPLYFYILPALVIVTGACFFITGAKVITTAVLLIVGIALVVSGVANLMGLLRHKPRTV